MGCAGSTTTNIEGSTRNCVDTSVSENATNAKSNMQTFLELTKSDRPYNPPICKKSIQRHKNREIKQLHLSSGCNSLLPSSEYRGTGSCKQTTGVFVNELSVLIEESTACLSRRTSSVELSPPSINAPFFEHDKHVTNINDVTFIITVAEATSEIYGENCNSKSIHNSGEVINLAPPANCSNRVNMADIPAIEITLLSAEDTADVYQSVTTRHNDDLFLRLVAETIVNQVINEAVMLVQDWPYHGNVSLDDYNKVHINI